MSLTTHPFVNSDPAAFDSNCAVCDGKERDCIHYPYRSTDPMTSEKAFALVAKHAGVTPDIAALKSKRPSKEQLQNALTEMVTDGVDLPTAREALWQVEKYFDDLTALQVARPIPAPEN